MESDDSTSEYSDYSGNDEPRDESSSTNYDDDNVSEEEIADSNFALASAGSESVEKTKTFVCVVFAIAAVTQSLLTFLYLRQRQKEDFRDAFLALTVRIADFTEFEAHNIFELVDRMSLTASSYAHATGATWPFIALPQPADPHDDSDHHHNSKKDQKNFVKLVMAPLVTSDNRQRWEACTIPYETISEEPVEQLDPVEVESDSVDYGVAHGRAKPLLSLENFLDDLRGILNLLGNPSNGFEHEELSSFNFLRHLGRIEDEEACIGFAPPKTKGDEEIHVQQEKQQQHQVRPADTPVIPPVCDPTAEIWRFVNGIDGEPAVQGWEKLPNDGLGYFAPVSFQLPTNHTPHLAGYDLLSHPSIALTFAELMEHQSPIVTMLANNSFAHPNPSNDDLHHQVLAPSSLLISPVYAMSDDSELQQQHGIVALVAAYWPWDRYFSGLLPRDTKGMFAVLSDASGQNHTFLIDGSEATFLGPGDLHDPKFNHSAVRVEFDSFFRDHDMIHSACCQYTLFLYPSAALASQYLGYFGPILYAVGVLVVFAVAALAFLVYDILVDYRQQKVMAAAKRTHAVVSSLFPANVRDRILNMQEGEEQDLSALDREMHLPRKGTKAKLKTFLAGNEHETMVCGTKPIADLFVNCTVMFADIAGFTAWSSVREPTQVFTLLETIYHSFDQYARRLRVFKVETIGDCYVAVAGLPEPRRDHAVVMARFASHCVASTNEIVKRLEVTLGPDTGDLAMRIGLHSGPVTAGVLRGDKSRFQLFGDTVNTAARVESTGAARRVQVSKETAELLITAGKGHWVTQREELVTAKGKGALQTYWLEVKSRSSQSVCSEDQTVLSGTTFAEDDAKTLKPADLIAQEEEKRQRLVDWNVDVLSRLLRQIIARREATKTRSGEPPKWVTLTNGQTVLDEVKEIIHLPEFDATAAAAQTNPESIELGPVVVGQLRDFVNTIASMYHRNPFHNFEHASHVAMSVVKLLGRIVAPDMNVVDAQQDSSSHNIASTLHDHTYGITSDPLTQFSCVFSALIHDVDHPGVPNAQLVKENVRIARLYEGKSVAEQNSIDIAWELLRDASFNELRRTICADDAEMYRFRQLVINSVMATDICDKELKALRNGRWDKAFKGNLENEEVRDTVNRKATIVIEHLIQASDVSHTMQHWQIYRKWNERLFQEMYEAYKLGRAETDPSEFWYKGEIGFFDFYIIPLAKKLADCGVFGVSSDEYLNYAIQNRQEWEARGQEVVASLIEKYVEKDKDGGEKSFGNAGNQLAQEKQRDEEFEQRLKENAVVIELKHDGDACSSGKDMCFNDGLSFTASGDGDGMSFAEMSRDGVGEYIESARRYRDGFSISTGSMSVGSYLDDMDLDDREGSEDDDEKSDSDSDSREEGDGSSNSSDHDDDAEEACTDEEIEFEEEVDMPNNNEKFLEKQRGESRRVENVAFGHFEKSIIPSVSSQQILREQPKGDDAWPCTMKQHFLDKPDDVTADETMSGSMANTVEASFEAQHHASYGDGDIDGDFAELDDIIAMVAAVLDKAVDDVRLEA